ncbi:MAG: hypothetical protein IT427_15430 [Pirellulales bacterium]|nr:hypothetical protein [Pirellulales bacterium]
MPQASVTDVAAIADFRAALANFATLVRQAVIDLEIESQRALQWITQDRPAHWRSEARRSSDMLARAKDDLVNARTFKKIDNYVPACAEEKKQVDRCKRRLEYADQKIDAVRRWCIAAPRAVDEFRGPLQQLMAMLDGDVPRAMAVLQRMSAALDRYAAAQAPKAIPWEAVVGTESIVRPAEGEEPKGPGVGAIQIRSIESTAADTDSQTHPTETASESSAEETV